MSGELGRGGSNFRQGQPKATLLHKRIGIYLRSASSASVARLATLQRLSGLSSAGSCESRVRGARPQKHSLRMPNLSLPIYAWRLLAAAPQICLERGLISKTLQLVQGSRKRNKTVVRRTDEPRALIEVAAGKGGLFKRLHVHE